MYLHLSAMLVLLTASMSPVMPGAGPETLQRSGKWMVNYDHDSCHLAAEFGAGDDKVIMRLTRFKPDDWLNLSIYGKRARATGSFGETKIDFGIGNKPVPRSAIHGTAAGVDAIFLGSLRLDGTMPKGDPDQAPRITPEQEARVTGVTVGMPGKRPFRLEFGSIAPAMVKLRECTVDLVKSWGYDPVVQAGLSRRPKPVTPPESWLTSQDYPKEAVVAGHDGIVEFRLDVDPQGQVAHCFVLSSTSPDDFADLTCKLVTSRAKFMPALDAKGTPVTSYYVHGVNWRS